MKCPSCDKRVVEKRCVCGWMDRSIQPGTSVRKACSWTTESRTCAMLATSSGLCLWHRYWLRLIEDGAPGRTEQEECAEWLNQYQPYGRYGSDPGQWWPSIEALWPALRGFGGAPLLTIAVERELFLRQSEVHRYRSGLPAFTIAPWPRLTGLPLPAWIESEWHATVDAQLAQRRQDKWESLKRANDRLKRPPIARAAS